MSKVTTDILPSSPPPSLNTTVQACCANTTIVATSFAASLVSAAAEKGLSSVMWSPPGAQVVLTAAVLWILAVSGLPLNICLLAAYSRTWKLYLVLPPAAVAVNLCINNMLLVLAAFLAAAALTFGLDEGGAKAGGTHTFLVMHVLLQSWLAQVMVVYCSAWRQLKHRQSSRSLSADHGLQNASANKATSSRILVVCSSCVLNLNRGRNTHLTVSKRDADRKPSAHSAVSRLNATANVQLLAKQRRRVTWWLPWTWLLSLLSSIALLMSANKDSPNLCLTLDPFRRQYLLTANGGRMNEEDTVSVPQRIPLLLILLPVYLVGVGVICWSISRVCTGTGSADKGRHLPRTESCRNNQDHAARADLPTSPSGHAAEGLNAITCDGGIRTGQGISRTERSDLQSRLNLTPVQEGLHYQNRESNIGDADVQHEPTTRRLMPSRHTHGHPRLGDGSRLTPLSSQPRNRMGLVRSTRRLPFRRHRGHELERSDDHVQGKKTVEMETGAVVSSEEADRLTGATDTNKNAQEYAVWTGLPQKGFPQLGACKALEIAENDSYDDCHNIDDKCDFRRNSQSDSCKQGHNNHDIFKFRRNSHNDATSVSGCNGYDDDTRGHNKYDNKYKFGRNTHDGKNKFRRSSHGDKCNVKRKNIDDNSTFGPDNIGDVCELGSENHDECCIVGHSRLDYDNPFACNNRDDSVTFECNNHDDYCEFACISHEGHCKTIRNSSDDFPFERDSNDLCEFGQRTPTFDSSHKRDCNGGSPVDTDADIDAIPFADDDSVDAVSSGLQVLHIAENDSVDAVSSGLQVLHIAENDNPSSSSQCAVSRDHNSSSNTFLEKRINSFYTTSEMTKKSDKTKRVTFDTEVDYAIFDTDDYVLFSNMTGEIIDQAPDALPADQNKNAAETLANKTLMKFKMLKKKKKKSDDVQNVNLSADSVANFLPERNQGITFIKPDKYSLQTMCLFERQRRARKPRKSKRRYKPHGINEDQLLFQPEQLQDIDQERMQTIRKTGTDYLYESTDDGQLCKFEIGTESNRRETETESSRLVTEKAKIENTFETKYGHNRFETETVYNRSETEADPTRRQNIEQWSDVSPDLDDFVNGNTNMNMNAASSKPRSKGTRRWRGDGVEGAHDHVECPDDDASPQEVDAKSLSSSGDSSSLTSSLCRRYAKLQQDLASGPLRLTLSPHRDHTQQQQQQPHQQQQPTRLTSRHSVLSTSGGPGAGGRARVGTAVRIVSSSMHHFTVQGPPPTAAHLLPPGWLCQQQQLPHPQTQLQHQQHLSRLSPALPPRSCAHHVSRCRCGGPDGSQCGKALRSYSSLTDKTDQNEGDIQDAVRGVTARETLFTPASSTGESRPCDEDSVAGDSIDELLSRLTYFQTHDVGGISSEATVVDMPSLHKFAESNVAVETSSRDVEKRLASPVKVVSPVKTVKPCASTQEVRVKGAASLSLTSVVGRSSSSFWRDTTQEVRKSTERADSELFDVRSSNTKSTTEDKENKQHKWNYSDENEASEATSGDDEKIKETSTTPPRKNPSWLSFLQRCYRCCNFQVEMTRKAVYLSGLTLHVLTCVPFAIALLPGIWGPLDCESRLQGLVVVRLLMFTHVVACPLWLLLCHGRLLLRRGV